MLIQLLTLFINIILRLDALQSLLVELFAPYSYSHGLESTHSLNLDSLNLDSLNLG